MAWSAKLLKRLRENDISFIVIGGVAAIAHGSARITEDVDICASLEPPNPQKIIAALADLHPRWRVRPDLPVLTPETELPDNLRNMCLRTDMGQLDILGELPGVGSFADLTDSAMEVDVMGVRCPVLDLDTLIAVKRSAGRAKDKPAIHELEIIRQKLRNP